MSFEFNGVRFKQAILEILGADIPVGSLVSMHGPVTSRVPPRPFINVDPGGITIAGSLSINLYGVSKRYFTDGSEWFACVLDTNVRRLHCWLGNRLQALTCFEFEQQPTLDYERLHWCSKSFSLDSARLAIEHANRSPLGDQ